MRTEHVLRTNNRKDETFMDERIYFSFLPFPFPIPMVGKTSERFMEAEGSINAAWILNAERLLLSAFEYLKKITNKRGIKARMNVKGNKLSQSLDSALHIGSTIKVAEISFDFSAVHSQPWVTPVAKWSMMNYSTLRRQRLRIHADKKEKYLISTAWKVKENSQR